MVFSFMDFFFALFLLVLATKRVHFCCGCCCCCSVLFWFTLNMQFQISKLTWLVLLHFDFFDFLSFCEFAAQLPHNMQFNHKFICSLYVCASVYIVPELLFNNNNWQANQTWPYPYYNYEYCFKIEQNWHFINFKRIQQTCTVCVCVCLSESVQLNESNKLWVSMGFLLVSGTNGGGWLATNLDGRGKKINRRIQFVESVSHIPNRFLYRFLKITKEKIAIEIISISAIDVKYV